MDHPVQLLRNYDVGYVKKKRDGRMTGDQIEAALKLKCYDTSMLLWKAAIAVSHHGNLPLGELRSEFILGANNFCRAIKFFRHFFLLLTGVGYRL